MAYANGRLPSSVLSLIAGTNKRLRTDLVPQTNALRAAFHDRFGKPLTVTDAYRPYAEQVALRASKGSFAAIPGTSNHGWGQAIDFGSGVNIEGSPEYRWMRANAGRYGWSQPLWARDGNPRNGQQEPWHWEAVAVPVSNYKPVGGSVPTAPKPTTPAPIDPEDDMTPAQEAALDQARNDAKQAKEDAGEARRMLGVLLGYNPPANSTEAKALARLLGSDTVEKIVKHENVTEPRRMLGALLGWNPGTGPEPGRIAQFLGKK